jgi:putative flippase GtrA
MIVSESFDQDKKMPRVDFARIIETEIKMIRLGSVGGLRIILNVEILCLLTNFLGIYYIISAILSYLP